MDNAARQKTMNSLGNLVPAILLFTLVIIHTSTPVTFLLKLTNGKGGAAVGAIWYIGALCALGLAFLRPLRTLFALPFAFPFLLISFWSLSSYFWSIAPIETLKGNILLFMTFLGGMVLATRLSWEELIVYLSKILNILILISAILAIAIPKMGTMQEIYPGAWSGLWPEKQALGFYSVVQVILVLIRVFYFPKQLKLLFWVPLGILAILGTQSKTALIMVLFAFAIIVFIKLLQQDLRIMMASLILATIAILIVGAVLMVFPDILFKLTGKSSDLTGRKEIWTALEFMYDQRKLTGYGYNAIWNGMEDMTSPYQWIPNIAGFKPFNAHSSYWEAKISLGQVGLYLLYFCLAWVMFFAIIHIRSHHLGSAITLAFMGALLIISRTETVFLGYMDLFWLMVITLGTKITMPKNDLQRTVAFVPNQKPRNETFVYSGL